MEFLPPKRKRQAAKRKTEEFVEAIKTKESSRGLYIAVESDSTGKGNFRYHRRDTFDDAAESLQSAPYPIGIYKRVADVTRNTVIHKVVEEVE